MKRIYLALLLITYSAAQAQVSINGYISTDKMTVEGAAVSALKKHSGSIICYTISDKTGFYKLPIITAADSLIIEVSHIGFAKVKTVVLNTSQEIDFRLIAQVFSLPEIKVDNNGFIIKRGDTINYKVAEFTAKSDRVVADIIKKLPGIEVGANGQIKYQGKPINHYYIENLDLLESKYNIANQNIPSNMVEGIQIFENHQPIKVLDSSVISDRAAINIRLKDNAKNKLIAILKAGLGLAPLLWESELIGLNFRKKFQSISGYKTNNTGVNVSNEIADLYLNPYNKQSFLSAKQDLLHLLNFGQPPFEEQRFLFNNSHLLYNNGLFVINKSSQFRYNINFLFDRTTQSAAAKTIINLPDSNILIEENQTQALLKNQLKSEFGYTVNQKKYFFKDNLKIEGYWDKQNAVLTNKIKSDQVLVNPMFQLINDCHIIFSKGKNKYEFISNLILQTLPQQLIIRPEVFKEFFNQSITYNQLEQSATQKIIVSDNAIVLRKNWFHFSQTFSGGISYQKTSINSAIHKDSANNRIFLKDSFQNQLSWVEIIPYAEISFLIQKKGFVINAKATILNSNLSRRDEANNINDKNNFLFPNNSFSIARDISRKLNISYIFMNEFRINAANKNTAGYILSNYRDVARNNPTVGREKIISNLLSLNYRNPLRLLFGYLSCSFSITERNLLQGFQYYNQLSSQNLVSIKNEQKALLLSFNLNKYFKNSRTGLSFNSSLTAQAFPQLQNGETVRLSNNNVTTKVNIYNRKLDWVFPELSIVHTAINNFIEAKGDKINQTPITQMSETLKMSFFISKSITLMSSFANFHNSFKGQESNSYLFVDAGINYKGKKYNVEIKAMNITGINNFTTINSFNNIQSVQEFQLRPLNILIQAGFRL